MRKIALTIGMLFLLSTIAYSQEYAVDKGSTIISGIGSYASQGGDLFEDSDGNGLTTIMLMPTIEYFIVPNIFIGGGLAFTRQSQGDNSYSTIGIGPIVGYAIGQAASKSYPYLAAGIRYYSIGYEDESISGTDIVISGGIVITARKHLGIVIEAGYHIMNLKHEDWDESESGNIISVGIGIAGLLF